jgi:hypothetical protein
MRSPKIKRSWKSGTSENVTLALKISCHIVDLWMLMFLMHGNVIKDTTYGFEINFRPFNA